MARRVVVTGLGTVNPLGHNVEDTWNKVKNGENGVGPLTRFDTEGFTSKVAAEVKDLDPGKWIEKKEIRRMDRFIQYAVIAATQAMADSGLESGSNIEPNRLSTIIGNGIGGIETLEEQHKRLLSRGASGIHPLFVPKMISNEAPGMVAIRFDARGAAYSIITACSSGSDAIGIALRMVRDGVVDAVICGGTEAPLTPLSVGGFCSLQAVSTRNDAPEKASRPFDKDRDGFVIGEGSGIIIIEALEHAQERGAKIYCEIAGYGGTCDAHHITAPHPDAVGGVEAMRLAVEDAGLAVEDIDYINAHGTSTPINDPTETKAIKALFGDHAYKLRVSSTKSMHGHLLGGAGGLEAVICAMAIKHQFVPPTRNLDNPDPECDLDYVPHKGVDGTIRAALSNSLGFGGHNGVLCFKALE